MNVNLFIEESDMCFKSIVSDSEFSNTIGISYFCSMYCSSIQMQWKSPFVASIKHVKFCFKDLTMMACLRIVTQQLLSDQNLSRLNISNVYVTDDVAKQVITIITDSCVMECLELVSLIISDHNLIRIFQALRNVNSLKNLTVNSINILGSICEQLIASVIEGNNILEHLEISNCNLKESAIIQISIAIKTVNSLKYLDLSKYIISNAAASELANTLNTINTLKHLDLSSTKLEEAGIVDIMQGLINSSLQHLSLSNCNITNGAATKIASCVLTSLTSLELSNCKLEETSLVCILEALTCIPSLCKINLSYNIITEAAALKLAKVIMNNPTITNLCLTPSGSSNVKVASSCSTIKFIDWKFPINSMTFSELVKLCQENMFIMIKFDDVNNSYASIDKDFREITHFTLANCSCMEMFKGLETLSSLQHLDVNFSTIAYDVISNIIKNNVSLKYINISNCSWKQSCNMTECDEDEIYDFIMLQDDIFYEISKNLSSLQQIQYLNISGNKITNRIAGVIATTIENNKRLQNLNFSNCQTQITGLLMILKALSSINCLMQALTTFLKKLLNYLMG